LTGKKLKASEGLCVQWSDSATSQVLEGFDPKLGLSDLKFRGLRTVEGSENTVTPRGRVLLGKLNISSASQDIHSDL
jgi:hypothetical protein